MYVSDWCLPYTEPGSLQVFPFSIKDFQQDLYVCPNSSFKMFTPHSFSSPSFTTVAEPLIHCSTHTHTHQETTNVQCDTGLVDMNSCVMLQFDNTYLVSVQWYIQVVYLKTNLNCLSHRKSNDLNTRSMTNLLNKAYNQSKNISNQIRNLADLKSFEPNTEFRESKIFWTKYWI